MAENGKSATQLINQWIDEGKVAVDGNNVPNIIQNAEDLSEVPMNASKWSIWRDDATSYDKIFLSNS